MATVLVVNTLQSIGVPSPKWVALGVAEAIVFLTAWAIHVDSAFWPVIAFLNGLLVYAGAVGINTAAHGANQVERGVGFWSRWF